jgi:hypothetical protein
MSEPSTSLYLVLIETSGNQTFIFSTNKLRENVGASEATYRACSQWVLEAVAEMTNTTCLWSDDTEELQRNLLSAELNPPIAPRSPHPVEVLVAASGKALLITRELEQAQQIIEQVTLRALRAAPGLDVCGAIEPFEWADQIPISEVSGRLHQKFEVVRSLRPSPETRFLRLPIVEDCRTSGLPAATLDANPDGRIPRSATSFHKREWATKALDERLPRLLQNTPFRFARSSGVILDEDDESRWLAVIHADGNGLGQIFINLEQYLDGDRHNHRNFIQQYRAFSLALDTCTRQAFLEALNVFPPDQRQPLRLVPLVLGGDDLTVICDAQYALAFTQRFLIAFEQATQASPVISQIAANAFDIQPGKLSACAGVAIVKPHFPFSTAYQLAEELTQSAKKVKGIVKRGEQTVPCSAIDFHVLSDTRGIRLEAIREKLTFYAEETDLYNRPYIVSKTESVMAMVGENENLEQWLKDHHWLNLEKRVKALRKPGQDEKKRRALPNSQMHALREGLFMGREGAEGQYTLIRKRYMPDIEDIAAENSECLFWQDAVTQRFVTGLLDAMDAADFWAENPSESSSENANENSSENSSE